MNFGDKKRKQVLAVAVCIIFAGFVFRLWVVSWPLEKQIGTFVADDAFYYSEIARNILAGNGPTFDGEIATNGFHPLWMVFCVGFQAVAGPDPESVLRLMLVFCAILSFICALLLLELCRRFVVPESTWGLWLVSLYCAANPFVIFTELMGVEGPLALAAVLAAVLAFEHWKKNPSAATLVITGIFAGLAFLARTDAGLFGLILAAAILFRAENDNPGGMLKAKRLLSFGLPAAAVAAPWLIWNLFRFGTIWQDSGRVLFYRTHSMIPNGDLALAATLKELFVGGFYNYFLRLIGGINLPITTIILGFGGGFVLCALILRRRPTGKSPWTLYAFAFTSWIFYIFYFQQQKFWYFLVLTASFAILAARLGAYLEEVFRNKGKWPHYANFIFALVMIFLFIPTTQMVMKNGYHAWQKTYLRAARDIQSGQIEGLDNSGAIGAFNAGIYGAFSGRRVVNLDGVVNPHIIEAMRAKRFVQYLREAGVRVIVDHQKLIATYSTWSQPGFSENFELIKRYKTSPFAGDVLVLRLKDVGSLP